MMRNKTLFVVEIIWIITGSLCLFAGLHTAIYNDGHNLLIFLLLTIISFLFAWFRHRQRKNAKT